MDESPIRLMMLNEAEAERQLRQAEEEAAELHQTEEEDSQFFQGMADIGSDTISDYESYDTDIWGMVGSDDDMAGSSDEATRVTEARVSVEINEPGVSNQAVVSAGQGTDGLTGGPSVCRPSCNRTCCQLVRSEEDADTVSLILLTLWTCIHLTLNHDKFLL